MVSTVYEIRVVGSLGPAAREAFSQLSQQLEPTMTVLYGRMEPDDLHGVLDQIGALGLQLVDVRHHRTWAAGTHVGADLDPVVDGEAR